jgi:hypothetical protein
MSGINKILAFITAVLFLTACQTVYVPGQYNFPLKEAKTNTYGCWMNLTEEHEPLNADTLKISPVSISGELICVEADTVFLLVSDHLVRRVLSGSIKHAELITHRNQAGRSAVIPLFSIIPSLVGAFRFTENAGYFLLMGVPAAIIGLVQSIWENSHKNILVYPEKNTIDDLSLFARFPAGKPLNMDFRQLTLKR